MYLPVTLGVYTLILLPSKQPTLPAQMLQKIDVQGIEIPDYERAEEFASPDNTEDESEDVADEEE